MKTTTIIKNLIRQFSSDSSNHWAYRRDIVKCLKALNIPIMERDEAFQELIKAGEIEAFEAGIFDVTCYGLIEHHSQVGRWNEYYNLSHM